MKFLPTHHYVPLLCCIVGLGTTTAAAQTTIFSDNFTGVAGSSGATSAGLNSIGWYSQNSGSTAIAYTTANVATSGMLTGTVMSNPAGSATNTLVNKQFSPITLSIGDSITLSLDFEYTKASATTGTLALNLLNTAHTFTGNAIGYGATDPTTDANGYLIQQLVDANATNPNYRKVTADVTSSLLQNALPATETGDQAAHHITFTVTRDTATTEMLSATLDGVTLGSYEDASTSIYNTFDTVRLSSIGSQSAFYYDNVTLTVVPEASTTPMLALTVALSLFARYQKARGQQA